MPPGHVPWHYYIEKAVLPELPIWNACLKLLLHIFRFFLESVINESVAHRNVDLNIIIITIIITVRLYGPEIFPYELRIPSSIWDLLPTITLTYGTIRKQIVSFRPYHIALLLTKNLNSIAFRWQIFTANSISLPFSIKHEHCRRLLPTSSEQQPSYSAPFRSEAANKPSTNRRLEELSI